VSVLYFSSTAVDTKFIGDFFVGVGEHLVVLDIRKEQDSCGYGGVPGWNWGSNPSVMAVLQS